MARLKDRTNRRGVTRGYTHLIKIGWDLRATSRPRNAEGKYPQPTRLPGFVIARNSVGPSGFGFDIAYDIMEKLGFSKEQIGNALVSDMRSIGLLPATLHFVLKGNATRDPDGDWEYPGTFTEARQCITTECPGIFCSGDGATARRAQPDRSTKEIPCNPVGKDGVDPKDYCSYSVPDAKGNKACKVATILMVQLIFKRGDTWGPIGLPSDVFAVKTGSKDADINFGSVLDAAANRLDGWITRLPGTLYFTVQRRNSATSRQTPTPQIIMTLDEASICHRERLINDSKMTTRLIEAGMTAAPRLLADPKDAEPITMQSGDAPVEVATEDFQDAEFEDDGNSNIDPNTPTALGPEQTAETVDLVPQTVTPAPVVKTPTESPRVAQIKRLANLCHQIGVGNGVASIEVLKTLTRDEKFAGFGGFAAVEKFATDMPERFDRVIPIYLKKAEAQIAATEVR